LDRGDRFVVEEMNWRSLLLILIRGDRFVVEEMNWRSLVVDFGWEAIAVLMFVLGAIAG
jgi:hypothetical protein